MHVVALHKQPVKPVSTSSAKQATSAKSLLTVLVYILYLVATQMPIHMKHRNNDTLCTSRGLHKYLNLCQKCTGSESKWH